MSPSNNTQNVKKSVRRPAAKVSTATTQTTDSSTSNVMNIEENENHSSPSKAKKQKLGEGKAPVATKTYFDDPWDLLRDPSDLSDFMSSDSGEDECSESEDEYYKNTTTRQQLKLPNKDKDKNGGSSSSNDSSNSVTIIRMALKPRDKRRAKIERAKVRREEHEQRNGIHRSYLISDYFPPPTRRDNAKPINTPELAEKAGKKKTNGGSGKLN